MTVPLSLLPSVNPYQCEGYRLPTEAEWEATCRASRNSRWPCGEQESCLDAEAWYLGNSGDQVHPVASKSSSILGVYDLGGNLWEWTHDPYTVNYPGGVDPHVESTQDEPLFGNTVRGGAYQHEPRFLRCAARAAITADRVSIGIRLARSILR